MKQFESDGLTGSCCKHTLLTVLSYRAGVAVLQVKPFDSEACPDSATCADVVLQVKRYDSEADKKLLETPDVNKYVFCQVLADCGQVRTTTVPGSVLGGGRGVEVDRLRRTRTGCWEWPAPATSAQQSIVLVWACCCRAAGA